MYANVLLCLVHWRYIIKAVKLTPGTDCRASAPAPKLFAQC